MAPKEKPYHLLYRTIEHEMNYLFSMDDLQAKFLAASYRRILDRLDGTNVPINERPLKMGKYAGMTPKEVVETNASYIVWACGNISGFLGNMVDEPFLQYAHSLVKKQREEYYHQKSRRVPTIDSKLKEPHPLEQPTIRDEDDF